jgi:hypothetical protein
VSFSDHGLATDDLCCAVDLVTSWAHLTHIKCAVMEMTSVKPFFPVLDDRRIDTNTSSTDAGIGSWNRADLRDPKRLSGRFVDLRWDETPLAELSRKVDPCGERGEFHTSCFRCPESSTEILVRSGEIVQRNCFWFADLQRAE